MTLAFFKFGLPALLGYTIFAGISGRLNIFSRPDSARDRASWALGIWSGLCVAMVLSVALHVAYDMPPSAVGKLLIPSLSALAVLILPAALLFIHRRNRLSKQQDIYDWETTVEIASPDLSMVAADETEADDVEWPGASELREELTEQIKRREETEKHLRITRKALAVLEADTRHFSIDKADGIIALEEQLASTIQTVTAHESAAIKERVRRIEVEQQNTELKQKMVKAKQEIRRGAAARARALSTANKSIAFARQCVQIRTRLEARLEDSQDVIDSRQRTISRLLRTLEKQKRKTNQEVSSMAKQLILHEKQLKARRSLEQVAKSVENKLTSRLVKKVAKAKPLN